MPAGFVFHIHVRTMYNVAYLLLYAFILFFSCTPCTILIIKTYLLFYLFIYLFIYWLTNLLIYLRTYFAGTTQLDFSVGKFVQTRRDCRQLVANSVHSADETQLDSWVASAVRIGLKQRYDLHTPQPWKENRGVYPPNNHGAIPPILTSSPLSATPPASNFWTLYTQFCAIYACFRWILRSCQSGIMTSQNQKKI